MQQEKNPFLNLKPRSLLLWFLATIFTLGSIVGAIASFGNLDPQSILHENPVTTLIVAYGLWDGLIFAWVLRQFTRLQISFRRLVGKLPNNYHWLPTVWIVVLLMLFSIGAFRIFYYFVSLVAPSFVERVLVEEPFLSALEKSTSLLHISIRFFFSVVCASIAEELLFRGVLFHSWATKWGINPALLISSLIFAILHRDIIGAFVFGLVMAVFYLKTRTLLVPIVCHALNNAGAIVLEMAAIRSEPAETVNILAQLHSSLWMGVIYIVLSAPGLIYFLYKNWPSRRSRLPYFANVSNSMVGT